MGGDRSHLFALFIGTGLFVQEDSQDGSIADYCHLYDYLQHDDAGNHRGKGFRLGEDGLHLLGRNARHVFHYYYL